MAVDSWQCSVLSRQSSVGSLQSAVLSFPAFAIATRLRFATDGQADGQAVFNLWFVVDGSLKLEVSKATLKGTFMMDDSELVAKCLP